MDKHQYLPSALRAKAQTLLQAGDAGGAALAYRQLLEHHSEDIEALFHLGVLAAMAGSYSQACVLLRKSVALSPDNWEIRINLGKAALAAGDLAGCEVEVVELLRLAPHQLDVRLLEADWLRESGRYPMAAERYEAILKEDTQAGDKRCEVLGGLAICLAKLGRTLQGVRVTKECLAHNPQDHDLRINLAAMLTRIGQVDEALEHYQAVLADGPAGSRGWDNFLMDLHYSLFVEPEAIHAWHKQFGANDSIQSPSPSLGAHLGEGPLRIGYVSADFRMHSVAYFLCGVFRAHNRQDFHITAYSNSQKNDEMTEVLKQSVDAWVPIAGRSDEAVSQRIQSDRIDVLIDLSGHTQGNRLGVFARRAAPIQVTWLGYPDTTGLSQIDYRLVDSITEPEGTDKYSSERLVRMPQGFHCYGPPTQAPDIRTPLKSESDAVFFGCFNNYAKLSEPLLAAWCALLQRLPKARLFLKARPLGERELQNQLITWFAERGVGRERLRLEGFSQSWDEHMNCYNAVDIALDTMPYNGTTTTCEALWMGVPVVTWCGKTHAGRVGASLLTHLEKTEWIANDPQSYISCAVELAQEQDVRRKWLQEARAWIQARALGNPAIFTEQLESAYRDMVTAAR